MAKITVANAPGTVPKPKNSTAGIRYTKAGMVCMKSSMGRMILLHRLLLAVQMPNGTPRDVYKRQELINKMGFLLFYDIFQCSVIIAQKRTTAGGKYEYVFSL